MLDFKAKSNRGEDIHSFRVRDDEWRYSTDDIKYVYDLIEGEMAFVGVVRELKQIDNTWTEVARFAAVSADIRWVGEE